MSASIRAKFLLTAAAGLLTLTACGPKTINHVLTDPSRYAEKEVKLQGRVVESYSVAGRGAYRLEDETGRLWIVSERGVPRQGARIEVKGKVKEAFNLGSVVQLPKDLSTGLVLIESSHKTKN